MGATGEYKATEWSDATQSYVVNPELGIQVDVEEMETAHKVVQSIGPPEGRFTFTSHESGDHLICLSTNATTSMFASGSHIRMHLDIVVGTTKADVEHDRTHVSDLASKVRRYCIFSIHCSHPPPQVRDLNVKLEDIRREQQYQREREADYRNLSEATNSRAVWYSVAQLVVLLGTCAWQLRHLKVCLVSSTLYGEYVCSHGPSDSSRTARCDELCCFTVGIRTGDLIYYRCRALRCVKWDGAISSFLTL